MNSVGSSPNSPVYRFYADDGVTPLAAGLWYVFLAGTSTPAFAYSQQDLDPGSQLTNPIVLDANGEATVYFSPVNGGNEGVSYKWDVQDSDGNSIARYACDDIGVPVPSSGGNVTSAVIGFGALTTLTIAGGSVTPTKNQHALNPEGGSPDDLVTLVTTSFPDGGQLILSNNNGSAAITIKSGTGNIFLASGDLVLSSTSQRVTLVRNGVNFYGITPPTATGDVVGPASSTDLAVARFDGTTGKLLQNSSAILSDAGLLTLPAGTGSGTFTAQGSLVSTTTTTGNSGLSETTLWTTTVPASTLAVDSDELLFYVCGTGDSGSDTKTLRVYWAGVQVVALTGSSSPAGTFPNWVLWGSIVRTGASSQVITVNAPNGLSTTTTVTSGSATLSSTNAFRISGQGASSNQLVLTYGRLRFAPHP